METLRQKSALERLWRWQRLPVFLVACLLAAALLGQQGLAAYIPATAPLLQLQSTDFVPNLNTDALTIFNTSQGRVQVLDGSTSPVLQRVGLATLLFTIEKCSILAPHVHTNTIEYAHVTGGSGTFSLWSSNGTVVLLRFPISSGFVAVVPPGWPHMFTGPESSSEVLQFMATAFSSDPQVYFLAGLGSIWSSVSGDAISAAFNVSSTDFASFFGAQQTGVLLLNETCASSSS